MTFRSLISDIKTDPTDPNGPINAYVSLGRITFWLLFAFMIYFWFSGIAIPTTLIDTFNIIVLYNFLKKPLDLLDNEAIKSWLRRVDI